MSDSVTRLNAALEGRYLIERELGQGGMATVYLAKDLKHERSVALKVLKPELAAVVGAERFLTEIKTTANLQHPHILPLFDSGEADGFLFYVMPYVQGETLGDRIDRDRQLPVEEAVRLATHVANALEHAHGHGIIHRDIKPANILLQDGEPVVADFGISLAVGAGGSQRLTETGLSVGTPYYMSPEQATGDQYVGPATDTYALACVLYEMLVGEPPYPGATAQAVLGKIIAGKPVSCTEHRPTVPANVDAAVRCALEKLPADRFASAQDFAKALADPGFRHGEEAAAGVAATPGPWKQLTVAFAFLFVLAAAIAGWSLLTPEPPRPVTRVMLGFPEGQKPLLFGSPSFAISRDGSVFVYSGGEMPGSLWVKQRGALRAIPLPGTEGAIAPVFSPDGSEIAFVQDGTLKRVPTMGGPAVTIAEVVNAVLPGAAWLDDGTIVYNGPDWVLWRTTSAGSTRDTIITPGREVVAGLGLAFPVGLPGSHGILFTTCNLRCVDEAVFVLDFRTGEARVLFEDVGTAWYVPTGHLAYVRNDGSMFLVPFDLERLEVTGSPVPVMEGIGLWIGMRADAVMSESGDLIYLEGGAVDLEQSFVWRDADGGQLPVAPEWVGRFRDPALSPDGQSIAVAVIGEGSTDIWTKRIGGAPPARLTFEGAFNEGPTWTPDGGSVSFLSDRGGNSDVWTRPADGSGSAVLTLDLDQSITEAVWSPDGEWLLYGTRRGGLAAIRPGLDSVATPIVGTEEPARNPRVSPDGDWIAYASAESGRMEIYVRPFPDVSSSGQRQVSTDGGIAPMWSASGRELFYVNGEGAVVVAEIALDPTLSVGAQRTWPVPEGQGVQDALLMQPPQYAPAPGGRRVLRTLADFVDISALTDARGRLVLVENWLTEVRRLFPN